MFRITKQTDYGIVLLSHMALEPERLFAAPELAAETQLPLPTVSKVLKLLARDGLLESHRGVKGGYCLARTPGDTTVTEIITSLEGPIAMTECVNDASGTCQQEAFCPLRGNWQVINRAVREALESITLRDMASPLAPEFVQLGRPHDADAPPA